MIAVDIPGSPRLELHHLVLDFNGTLAVDGQPVSGVKTALGALSQHLQVHVLTADTFGQVRSDMADVPCQIFVLPPGDQDIGKLDYIRRIGPGHCICIGNGRNDALMLKEAALGIAVILDEGCAVKTLMAADVVCTAIGDALALLRKPLRLTATLRS